MRRVFLRWTVRGIAALLAAALFGGVVVGARSVFGAVLAALSLGAVMFVVAELTGWWPVSRRHGSADSAPPGSGPAVRS